MKDSASTDQKASKHIQIFLFLKILLSKNLMYQHNIAISLVLAIGFISYFTLKLWRSRLSSSHKTYILNTLRIILSTICLYSLTPWAENQNMLKHRHTYSNLKMLYFTNQSACLSLIAVGFGFIYRYKSKYFQIYNTILPTAIAFETFLVSIFWPLYFKIPSAVMNKKATMPGFETPILTELGLHLFPFILLIVDQIDFKIKRTRVQSVYLITHLASWISIIVSLRLVKGKFMYPIMNYTKNIFILAGGFGLCALMIYLIHYSYIYLKRKSTLSVNK